MLSTFDFNEFRAERKKAFNNWGNVIFSPYCSVWDSEMKVDVLQIYFEICIL